MPLRGGSSRMGVFPTGTVEVHTGSWPWRVVATLLSDSTDRLRTEMSTEAGVLKNHRRGDSTEVLAGINPVDQGKED